MTHGSNALRLGWNYRGFLLVLLAALYAFNYVDRLALGLVLQNIKAAFALTDTELGLLTGIAFALFHATLGIPFGRWADRGNRVTIITLTAGLWSLMVMLCGTARSFVQLLFIRMGVAIGEAGGLPPAYSLIGDYFTRAERPKALANYLLGGPLCIIIGYFGAGWLNQLYGWRVMFGLLGLPGLMLAILTHLTVKEPRLEASKQRGQFTTTQRPHGLYEIGRTLWLKRTFRHIILALSVNAFFGVGIMQWLPAFFIRSYGLSTGELGTWFAVVYGGTGVVGTYFGGCWASRYASRNERLQLRVIAFVCCAGGATMAVVYLSHNAYVSFVMLSIGAIGACLCNGPLLAIMQTVVPPKMRGISMSILSLFISLIGAGLGPLVVGALSDALRPRLGSESLRYALLAMCPGYLWIGWHMLRAARAVTGDIEAESQESEAPAVVALRLS